MIRTLADKWERSCKSKTRHATEREALQEASRMSWLEKAKFKYYHCECCGGYHVAHVTPRMHSMHFR